MVTRKVKPKQTAEDRRLAANHLETRLVKTTCRKCLRPILSGHVSGEPTKIERIRLNRQGEVAALLAGMKTFEQSAPGGHIHRRRGYHIGLGMPKYGYVLAEHRCEHRWPASQFDLREIFASQQEDACPPF